MKKLFIFSVVLLAGLSSFAQRRTSVSEQSLNSFTNAALPFQNNALGRTTHIGDTVRLNNIADTSSLVIYKLGSRDSGFVTGTNYWNDMAFAERYSFNQLDSSMVVIGIFAQFAGHVNTASTKSIAFKVWGYSDTQRITTHLYYTGYPRGLNDSFVVPVTQLGIGPVADTMKKFIFSTPTSALAGPFFVGYSINYNFADLAGDTIGLASSRNGVATGRDTNIYVNITDFGDTVTDTFIYVQNATQESDGKWYDNYTQNDSIKNNLAIYPIVIIKNPTGINSITRNGLKFYGNYPNPTYSSTHIKFELADAAGVSLQIFDVANRLVSELKQTNYSAGEHIIDVNTTTLATGEYIYLLKTSAGDGMAGKIIVGK